MQCSPGVSQECSCAPPVKVVAVGVWTSFVCVSAGRLVWQEGEDPPSCGAPADVCLWLHVQWLCWCFFSWLCVHVFLQHCCCDSARVAVMVSCCGHNRLPTVTALLCLPTESPLMGRLVSVACAWPECWSTRRGCVGSSPMQICSRCWAPPDMGLCGASMIWCEAMPWAPGSRVNSAVVCMASQRGAAPPVVPTQKP